MKRILLLSALVLLLASVAVYAGYGKGASLSAENTWTDGVLCNDHGSIEVSGTWVGTLTLQRSRNGSTGWVDTGDTKTSNGVFTFTDYTDKYYRIGFATGGYTSGTAVIWIEGAE